MTLYFYEGQEITIVREGDGNATSRIRFADGTEREVSTMNIEVDYGDDE